MQCCKFLFLFFLSISNYLQVDGVSVLEPSLPDAAIERILDASDLSTFHVLSSTCRSVHERCSNHPGYIEKFHASPDTAFKAILHFWSSNRVDKLHRIFPSTIQSQTVFDVAISFLTQYSQQSVSWVADLADRTDASFYLLQRFPQLATFVNEKGLLPIDLLFYPSTNFLKGSDEQKSSYHRLVSQIWVFSRAPLNFDRFNLQQFCGDAVLFGIFEALTVCQDSFLLRGIDTDPKGNALVQLVKHDEDRVLRILLNRPNSSLLSHMPGLFKYALSSCAEKVLNMFLLEMRMISTKRSPPLLTQASSSNCEPVVSIIVHQVVDGSQDVSQTYETETPDTNGAYAIHYAAASSNTNLFRLVQSITNCHSTYAVDHDGKNLAHFAALGGSTEILNDVRHLSEFLLTLANNEGETPIDIAFKMDHAEAVLFLWALSFVGKLSTTTT
jgi:hypothetical protein